MEFLVEIIKPVLSLTVLAVVFGGILAWADKVFAVKKNPRVDEIIEVLPGANCGACGYAGCAAFAEAVAKGEAPVNGCPVGRQKVADEIAKIMGVSAACDDECLKARLVCQGSDDVAKTKMIYHGIDDCRAAVLLHGGDKTCPYGCLGLGTCVRVCPFDAISMGDNGLPVIDSGLCTGCNKCRDACPKGVIRMVPEGSAVLVACNSHDKGAAVVKACKVGCIACGKCVKVCPEDAIALVDNLAVIDPAKCTNCGACVEACPTKAIIRL
ncbi:MAG TPA: RnfABCDGE type electron transport complex subunit B [Bacillota bacterium]|nr:RnfABCDGE type electron transport complex subunit B [Bacillota bacterium]HQE02184.1 RnfABCDGE type electron transport complex subunit B [Bacillota bacterium]